MRDGDLTGAAAGVFVVTLVLVQVAGCAQPRAQALGSTSDPALLEVEREPPTPVPELRELFVAATWGCVLDEDGDLWCWGEHLQHELGHPSVSAARLDMPGRLVAFTTERVRGVSPPHFVSCASFATQDMRCWEHSNHDARAWGGPFPGTRDASALALYTGGTTSEIACAQTSRDVIECFEAGESEPSFALLDVVDLGHVGERILGLVADGRVLWLTAEPDPYGETQPQVDNEYGRLPGALELVDSPTLAPLCGLDESGVLICAGESRLLPSSYYTARPMPALAVVARTDRQACVLTRDGEIQCGGSNRWGQFGAPGAFALAKSDLQPRFEHAEGVIDVGVTNEQTCLMTKTELRCFGRKFEVSTSDQRSELALDARRLLADDSRTCAVDRDDRTWCWGPGIDGVGPRQILLPTGSPIAIDARGCFIDDSLQIACGTLEPAPNEPDALVLVSDGAPRQVAHVDTSGAYAVRVDGQLRLRDAALEDPRLDRHLDSSLRLLGPGCALDSSDTLTCFVREGTPDGPRVQAESVSVPQVAALASHCALHVGGRVSCWSWDPGEAIDVGLSDGVEIAASSLDVCVRRRDESLACIPKDGEGEPSEPVAAPVVDIVAGPRHMCALQLSGTVSCWGDNKEGELGVVPPDVSVEGWTIEFEREGPSLDLQQAR